MNTVFTILIPLGSLGIGCFLLYVSLRGYFSTRSINTWEITQGIITKSNLKQAGTAFLPDVEYQYFVLGVEYKGIAVTIPPDLIYNLKVAQGLLAEYPVDKKVDVFYNPEIPRIAVLEKESSVAPFWMTMMLIITASAFLIFGLAYLIPLFRR